MPVVIPMKPDGDRVIQVDLPSVQLKLRTYYSVGQQPMWLLDLLDGNDAPLITGIALVPGSDNVIKGQGDILYGHQLYVLTLTEEEISYTDPGALGNTLVLLLYLPGEENLYKVGDPLLTLPPIEFYPAEPA